MSRKHKLTRDEEDDIRKLIANGTFTRQELADIHNVSMRVIDAIVAPTRKKGHITQEMREEVIKLVLSGHHVGDLADKFGVHISSVYTWCHRHRLSHKNEE